MIAAAGSVAPASSAPAAIEPPPSEPVAPEGIYLHVPFCVSLCPYCDFVVHAGAAARGPRSRVDAFVDALHAEIDLRADELDGDRVDVRPHGVAGRPRSVASAPISVYFGGGTPSLLAAATVAGLLEHVERRFGLAAGAEITLEANPGADEIGDLAGFRAAGVGRLSIGAQSMARSELRSIGRRHDPDDVAVAVRSARRAGFGSISLDLLTDLPGQSVASWRRTLSAALDLGPDHLSVYGLALDDPDAEGLTGPDGDHLPVRAGARRWRERARTRQSDERAAEMDALTDELAAAAGLARYEIANLARPGHESRHNRLYWRRRPYLGLGPGAHSSDGHLVRRWNAARLDTYLLALTPAGAGRRPLAPPGGREVVDEATAQAESAILGLRLREGLPAEVLDDPRLAPGLAWGRSAGLLEVAARRVRLTDRGRALANEVAMRLLPDGLPRDGDDRSPAAAARSAAAT